MAGKSKRNRTRKTGGDGNTPGTQRTPLKSLTRQFTSTRSRKPFESKKQANKRFKKEASQIKKKQLKQDREDANERRKFEEHMKIEQDKRRQKIETMKEEKKLTPKKSMLTKDDFDDGVIEFETGFYYEGGKRKSQRRRKTHRRRR